MALTPITERPDPPRTRLPELGSVDPLPDYALPLAPEPVAEASKAFAAALERLDEAQAGARAAVAAVEAAGADDRHAAREAEASGKAIPKSTVPKAQEARELAERAVPAAEWHARETLDHYLAALRDHRDQIDGAAAEKETALAAVLIRRVDEVEDALMRLDEISSLRRELEEPPAGRHPVFSVRPARRLVSDLARPLEALRSQLGGR